jgi:hypothetical protein
MAQDFSMKESGRTGLPVEFDTTGFRANYLEEVSDWEEERISALKEIHAELAQQDSAKVNREMKNKIARLVFEMVENTPLQRDVIGENAYVISTFIEYEFDDELDKVFELAAGLVPPYAPPLQEQRIYDSWTKMYELLEKYLRSEGKEKL